MALDGNSQVLPGGSGGLASVVHPQVSFIHFLIGSLKSTLIMSGVTGTKMALLHELTSLILCMQFYQTDLGPGQHTISMSGASQGNTNSFIDLDMINVFDVATLDPTSTSASSSVISTTTASSNNGAAIPSTSSVIRL